MKIPCFWWHFATGNSGAYFSTYSSAYFSKDFLSHSLLGLWLLKHFVHCLFVPLWETLVGSPFIRMMLGTTLSSCILKRWEPVPILLLLVFTEISSNLLSLAQNLSTTNRISSSINWLVHSSIFIYVCRNAYTWPMIWKYVLWYKYTHDAPQKSGNIEKTMSPIRCLLIVIFCPVGWVSTEKL